MMNESLPGVRKRSFAMAYGGGEIWFEHLDGIHDFTDAALEKLERDYETFKKPSAPSLVAVNIDETHVTDALIKSIAEKLCDTQKRYMKVVFVGADRRTQKKLLARLDGAAFATAFINDFEKAKEWLVSERY